MRALFKLIWLATHNVAACCFTAVWVLATRLKQSLSSNGIFIDMAGRMATGQRRTIGFCTGRRRPCKFFYGSHIRYHLTSCHTVLSMRRRDSGRRPGKSENYNAQRAGAPEQFPSTPNFDAVVTLWAGNPERRTEIWSTPSDTNPVASSLARLPAAIIVNNGLPLKSAALRQGIRLPPTLSTLEECPDGPLGASFRLPLVPCESQRCTRDSSCLARTLLLATSRDKEAAGVGLSLEKFQSPLVTSFLPGSCTICEGASNADVAGCRSSQGVEGSRCRLSKADLCTRRPWPRGREKETISRIFVRCMTA